MATETHPSQPTTTIGRASTTKRSRSDEYYAIQAHCVSCELPNSNSPRCSSQPTSTPANIDHPGHGSAHSLDSNATAACTTMGLGGLDDYAARVATSANQDATPNTQRWKHGVNALRAAYTLRSRSRSQPRARQRGDDTTTRRPYCRRVRRARYMDTRAETATRQRRWDTDVLGQQQLVSRGGVEEASNALKTIAPPFVPRRAAGSLAVTDKSTATRGSAEARKRRQRRGAAQREGIKRADVVRHAYACAEGLRDGPRTTMRTVDLKIRLSVPLTNEDDGHEREGRCDAGEGGHPCCLAISTRSETHLLRIPDEQRAICGGNIALVRCVFDAGGHALTSSLNVTACAGGYERLRAVVDARCDGLVTEGLKARMASLLPRDMAPKLADPVAQGHGANVSCIIGDDEGAVKRYEWLRALKLEGLSAEEDYILVRSLLGQAHRRHGRVEEGSVDQVLAELLSSSQNCELHLRSGSVPPLFTHPPIPDPGNGTRLLNPCNAPNLSLQRMHLLAGGKFKRAIFAGNAAERTLDGTNNGPRAMRNGLETRNGAGGEGHARKAQALRVD
ncbi:hypothetical protein BJ912DRAFT_1044007 [Pholiota molesta]|nr:hypothetical protein BJ912DRAFT_1044007 [Pholiota molesta]